MFRFCSQYAIASVLVLAGCSQPVPISDADRLRVERFIADQQRPLPVRHLAMWYSEGEPPSMVCGEIEAPPALQADRSRLRYVFFLNAPRPEGTVEMHELVAAGDARGEQIILESRRIFDRAWQTACEGVAPSGVLRWLRGPGTAGDGGTDTPLTNAYTEELLKKAR